MSPFADFVERCAQQALSAELRLEGKPGLVTPTSTGSHQDMDCSHFKASIAALAGYFGDCARLGARGAGFAALQARGLDAERTMLAATRGINTHKGAIFTLGLLAAAAGRRSEHGDGRASPGDTVACTWGSAILAAGIEAPAATHGARVRHALGLPGAREQAAGGFPTLFETTLPALAHARARLGDSEAAMLHALVSTIAVLPDTNLAHRGGVAGLQWAQQAATEFLTGGSVFTPRWKNRLDLLCDGFVARHLSPGGSADLLAAALMLARLDPSLCAIHRESGVVTA